MPPTDPENSRQQRIEFLQQDKRQAQQVFRELQGKADPYLISLDPSPEEMEKAFQKGIIVEDCTPYRSSTAASPSPSPDAPGECREIT